MLYFLGGLAQNMVVGRCLKNCTKFVEGCVALGTRNMKDLCSYLRGTHRPIGIIGKWKFCFEFLFLEVLRMCWVLLLFKSPSNSISQLLISFTKGENMRNVFLFIFETK